MAYSQRTWSPFHPWLCETGHTSQQPASSLSRCRKDCLGEWQKCLLHFFQYFFPLPENLGYFQVLTRHRGPQAFWQQEPVLWKIFPRTGVGGWFWIIQGHYIYCALYFYYYYLSSTSDHQALDWRGWGPWDQGTVVRQTPHHTHWEVKVTSWP